jgi:F-type H+-transporting ATPase subunit epsilon
MGAFPLEILTPKSVLCDLYVNQAILPAYDGEVGVLPQHADFIGELGTGVVRTWLDDDDMFFVVSGGFYRVVEGKLMIMAAEAENAEKVDEAKAKEVLPELEKRLEEADFNTDEPKELQRLIALNRARIQAVELLNSH